MTGDRRVLIYRRTHIGDPCRCGVFGVCDCMGSCRDWDLGAVLGVGGVGAAPRSHGIAEKLTWVGIGPKKGPEKNCRGSLVTSEHFCLMDKEGPLLRDDAPGLASHMCAEETTRRFAMSDSLSPDLRDEVQKLVSKYEACGPSARQMCECSVGLGFRESKREQGEEACRPRKTKSSC